MTKVELFGAVTVILLVISAFTALFSFEIVEPGNRGVYISMGDVTPEDLQPGFHWKAPWSKIHEESAQQTKVEQEVDAASQDLQSIKTTIAVTYVPTNGLVYKLYSEVGSREEWEKVLMRPKIEEVTKSVTARYSAEGLISKRLEMKTEIQKRLTAELGEDLLSVQDVSIVNFTFDSAFMDSVTKKQIAEQDTLRARNELEKAKIESQRQVAEAEAQNKAKKFATDARAYEVTAMADAEKQAQEKIASVLRENPNLLQWRWLEKWDGRTPTVIAGGNSGTTFLIPGNNEKK